MDAPAGSSSEAEKLSELNAHWLKSISTALEDGRVDLVRQPVVALQGADEARWYELSVRIRNDSGACLPKDLFATVVEQPGIAGRLDRWAFLEVLHWLRTEDEECGGPALCFYRPLSLSVTDESFAFFVSQEVSESRVDPKRVCLEIAYADVVKKLEQVERFIDPLRTLGCRTMIGDGGSEHLAYLHTFRTDFMGLDRRLVAQILHDAAQRDFMRGVNQIGHTFRRTTVAKGANSPELVAILREMKVDYAVASAI